MRGKLLILAVCLLAAPALAIPSLIADGTGTIYKYWTDNNALKLARSIDQGITFSQPLDLYLFTGEVNSFDLKIDQGRAFYLAYSVSREVFFTCSVDSGRKFSQPRLLAVQGETPALAFADQQLVLAWAADGRVIWTRSGDRGFNWLFPEQLELTGEALAAPSVAIDRLNNPYLTFIGRNANRQIERLYFTALSSLEPVSLYETSDRLSAANIIATPWALLVLWQTAYSERQDSCGRLSLDRGRHFGSVKTNIPVALLSYVNRWFTPAPPPATGLKENYFSPPPSPQLISATGAATVEIAYRPRTAEPTITKFEIAGRKEFPASQTWSFDHLETFGSPETSFRLPIDLPEGKYYLRLSAFDGLAASQPSLPGELKVDRTPPVITLTAPAAETTETAEVSVSGALDEPAALTINGRPVSVEASGAFRLKTVLRPGANTLEVVATDATGNTALLRKNIAFLPVHSALTVSKPRENDWYKPGGAIHLQVSVSDPQVEIADEAEADILVADRLLPDKIVYAADDRSLTGFCRLPADLGDGLIPARIRVKDLSGKTLEGKFTVRLDSQPPRLGSSAVFSNDPTRVIVPLVDGGSGPDPAGTLVRIAGISLETIATAEPDKIIFQTRSRLAEGTYEVTVAPRDRVGNTGTFETFLLTIDITPPTLTLRNSAESEAAGDRLLLQGEAVDRYLAAINVYNDRRLIDSFTPPGPLFGREVPLRSGANDLLVEAKDRAGNTTAVRLSVNTRLETLAVVINSLENGPNPFSPKSNGQCYFIYSFAGPSADLSLYLFDLTGTLLWKKTITGTTAGQVSWNGIDQFGQAVANGVYPYLAVVTAGGQREIKRGKVIVLQ